MSKVIAKYEDCIITVEDHGGRIEVLFNDEQDEQALEMLNHTVEMVDPMSGTFYPEPGTMLGYFNAMTSMGMDVVVEGDIGELPCEDGVVY